MFWSVFGVNDDLGIHQLNTQTELLFKNDEFGELLQ